MNLLNKTKLFFKRNSSTILTCTGALGVIGTAIAAAKATPKATLMLQLAECDKGEELTITEKIKIAAPAYIPSAIIGASTIGCIFGANVLNKRQQASLISAYALLDNSYREYKNKVKDIYGVEGHDMVVEELYQDKCGDHVCSSDDKINIFDFFSLQFFESTLDDIRKAEKYINDCLETRGYVALSEFYDEIGITSTDMDCALGWSAGLGHNNIEFIVEQNDDHYILTMSTEPTPNYFYY